MIEVCTFYYGFEEAVGEKGGKILFIWIVWMVLDMWNDDAD